ncbi:MAG: DUF4412 domain-containing protein [Desulfobacterales bacterium]|nr:DUF4412 domain-containing protein [Desulfobacterales bacterium]
MSMKTGLNLKIALIVSVLILALSGVGMAADFSADYVQKTQGKTMNGKIYIKGKKIRTETNTGGQKTVSIIDLSKAKVIILFPGQRMYMETHVDKDMEKSFQTEDDLGKIAAKKLLGTETVNGYKCQKYHFTFHDKSLGASTHWISKKLQCPIKMISKGSHGEVTMEYKNIKVGGVKDSLFQVPAGYTVMGGPGMGFFPGGQR